MGAIQAVKTDLKKYLKPGEGPIITRLDVIIDEDYEPQGKIEFKVYDGEYPVTRVLPYKYFDK